MAVVVAADASLAGKPRRWSVVAALVAVIAIVASRRTVAFVPPEPAFLGKRLPSSPSSSSSSSSTSTISSPSTSSSSLLMTEQEAPGTFREAEILGLKLMQEGNYKDALNGVYIMKARSANSTLIREASLVEDTSSDLNGLQLKGSRPDVIRTKRLSGPSPVGGSTGGMESRNVDTLDEFELQAAHYNMACAHAQLGNLSEAIVNLQTAFENGFDNFATVRSDPDLDPIKGEKEFAKLMSTYEPRGFNPFGKLFGNGKK